MRLIFALFLSFLAGPALALSCLPATPMQVYHGVAEAEEAYIILHGSVAYNTRKLPRPSLLNGIEPPASTKIKARFQGKGLTRNGFSGQGSTRDITLDVQCLLTWCGGVQPEVDHLFFVEMTSQGPELSLGPCGGHAFAAPKQADLDQIAQCFAGGWCPEPEEF